MSTYKSLFIIIKIPWKCCGRTKNMHVFLYLICVWKMPQHEHHIPPDTSLTWQAQITRPASYGQFHSDTLQRADRTDAAHTGPICAYGSVMFNRTNRATCFPYCLWRQRVSITLTFQPAKKKNVILIFRSRVCFWDLRPISSDTVSRAQWAYCIYKHTHTLYTQALHFSDSKNMLFVYGLEIQIDRWAFKARETLIWGQIRLYFLDW